MYHIDVGGIKAALLQTPPRAVTQPSHRRERRGGSEKAESTRGRAGPSGAGEQGGCLQHPSFGSPAGRCGVQAAPRAARRGARLAVHTTALANTRARPGRQCHHFPPRLQPLPWDPQSCISGRIQAAGPSSTPRIAVDRGGNRPPCPPLCAGPPRGLFFTIETLVVRPPANSFGQRAECLLGARPNARQRRTHTQRGTETRGRASLGTEVCKFGG